MFPFQNFLLHLLTEYMTQYKLQLAQEQGPISKPLAPEAARGSRAPAHAPEKAAGGRDARVVEKPTMKRKPAPAAESGHADDTGVAGAADEATKKHKPAPAAEDAHTAEKTAGKRKAGLAADKEAAGAAGKTTGKLKPVPSAADVLAPAPSPRSWLLLFCPL